MLLADQFLFERIENFKLNKYEFHRASLYQFWTCLYKKILSIFEQKLGLDLFKSN